MSNVRSKPRTFGLVELLRKEKEQTQEAISPSMHESPSTNERASTDESPSTHASPSTEERAFKLEPLGLSNERAFMGARAFTHESPKAISGENLAPYRKGDSRVNHDFFDSRLCSLEPLAQLLYFHLNRYREGASSLTVVLSWSRLTERIPVSESTLRRAFARLNQAGLVFKEREAFGRGGVQGIVFRVVTGESPSTHASPSMGDTHKRKALKENNKRDSAPPDYKNCPDCQGSGFWYPEGVEKGVAKCKHERLKAGK
jgi:DNA-binding transcriptional ArsR family regulator